MRILKHIGKIGVAMFVVGASLDATGTRLDWVPYAMVAAGLAMVVSYIIIDREFYFGD